MTFYCAKQAVGTEIKPRLSCLFVSPMDQLADVEDEYKGNLLLDIDNKTACFHAEKHLDILSQFLSFMDLILKIGLFV